MAVAERVDSELRAATGRGLAQRPLGALVVAAEVRPPETRREREPCDHDGDELEVDRERAHAHADGDHRLADRDQHDEAVALDEVLGADHEAVDLAQERRDPLGHDRDPEQDVGGGATGDASCEHQQRRREVERRQPEDGRDDALGR